MSLFNLKAVLSRWKPCDADVWSKFTVASRGPTCDSTAFFWNLL